ncbi:MAG: hypothetical protein GX372_01375 [Ignavibacteria bacterium]|jgi:hypothetical protein|nr:hypothetical protein [Ignavibacteria bacterium]
MKKIGFLFGDEIEFSKAVMEVINSDNNLDVKAEEIKLGILGLEDKSQYSVIFDRFSIRFPFYKSVMRFFEQQGTKIVNSTKEYMEYDNFLGAFELKKIKINVPKMAIIPSKALPEGVDGSMLGNLIYPLNWEEMFDKIGFPANIMLNNSKNGIYDCFKIYNQQEFYPIYDMSADETLILQQAFEQADYFKVFVVGSEKYMLNYDINKPLRNRYSLIEQETDDKTAKKIDTIIKTIKKHFDMDIFDIDCVLVNEKIYVNYIDKSIPNIDALFLPEECYKWLTEKTAELLINYVKKTAVKTSKTVDKTRTTTSKKTAAKKTITKK